MSNWLRPGAATSPERLFCHVYGRGKGQAQMIPGWPYSVIAALEPGRTSWTAVLDAVRLGPDDDETEVTAAQVRDVITRLIGAGHWRQGDPRILVVFDAGYDVTRLAWLLADLPVDLLGRLRSDRVMQLPAPPPRPGALGRPRKHGGELALADPATWPAPQLTTSPVTTRYGTAVAAAWDRVHPRLTHRAAWLDHQGDLPVIDGTLIRLQVDHLPGDRDPKPVWLWSSATGAAPAAMDRLWQAFLRRFDLEHTFRLFKQVLGWTAPKIRDPAAADRWTWLIIAAYAQLRLARPLAADLRRPWERPAPPGRLTPARVRRGFRNIRAKTAQPASAPKPGKPGPDGRQAQRTGIRHPVMTWGKRPRGNAPSTPGANAQVKRQAKGPVVRLVQPARRHGVFLPNLGSPPKGRSRTGRVCGMLETRINEREIERPRGVTRCKHRHMRSRFWGRRAPRWPRSSRIARSPSGPARPPSGPNCRIGALCPG